MFLQSLELFGFKSFAQKTTLNFHRGVTAIVGPNGCGKSNVLDAIRWVLGEQSAKALRGGEMADVIFSGTDSRQAVGMAEVSMTFADCEKELGVAWNEVRITRRVFRDGNSEYLLNKAPCRLRDIHQLFMDTGIGRSAYSIMEQGKIDLILSSRPEDRRAIFEEAAGITRFKSQRKEALRKLEHTEANLLRVTDIVKEVKRQIGSLQRQAGKARRYQTLLTDLKVLETHHARHQFEQLDAAIGNAQSEVERLRVLHETQAADIEAQETALANDKHALEALDQELTAARQVVQELRNSISNAENRIGFNGERITEFAALVERYQRDVAAAEEKLAVQESQIESTDHELAQISQLLQTEQVVLEERRTATGATTAKRAELERALQNVFNTISRGESRITSLRNEIASAHNAREGSEARITMLQDELDEFSSTRSALETQNEETAAQLKEATASLDARKQEVQSAEQAVRETQNTLGAAENELRVKQRTLSEKESKLEVLRQLNEEGEGFGSGTQAVLRGLDNPNFFKPAIAGSLALHMEVEPDFIPAVEAALGSNLQAVLLKDPMIAESVIKTLHAKKLGRASLALRDLLPADPAPQPALPEGAISWATDKVRAEGEISLLIAHLLRKVAIVQDVETALRLKATHRELAFVTLTGETMSVEGVVVGGQTGQGATNSVLFRKTQIATLATEADEARAAIEATTAAREAAANASAEARNHVEALRQETQNLSLQVSTLRGQTGMLERELRDATKKLESLGWEKDETERRQREAGEKLARLEEELKGGAVSLTKAQEQHVQLQQQVEEIRKQESELNTELNELRIKVATEKQRHDSLRSQRQPMAARLHELRELIGQRRRDIEGYQAKSAQLTTETERICGEIEITRGRVGEAEETVTTLATQRAERVAAIEAQDASMRILRRQLSESQDQRGQHEVRQTQLQLRLDGITENVTKRYNIDIREFCPDTYALLTTLRDLQKKRREESAPAQQPAGSAEVTPAEVEAEAAPQPEPEVQRTDWDLVERFVKELDGKIDSMGPINIDAIQEYDELEQRHTFLEQQYNDLTNAKTELLDVIGKINVTTKKLFAETFEKVRVNFSEMFVELFGGGKANLVLVDESDPLESGIDIIAKPPGKQLQSISLLSGGEKTMTAVALLFSIYMVKPSPFCVLDEMDAPLDESNINRFIKILDRFVGQSQFVVITHNKRTIAKADVLYGVTMEEHGVSKLVGVKFARREDSEQGEDVMGSSNPVPVPSVAESFGKSGELHSEQLVG